MKTIVTVSTVIVTFLVSFTATAFAMGGVSAVEPAFWDIVRPVLDAIRGGDYWQGAALGVVVLATAAKRYGARWVPWLNTGPGGATTALVIAFGSSLAAQLAGGADMSWAAIKSAGQLAGGAAAIYSLARALLVPTLKRLAARWGGWRGQLLSLALWAFDRPDAAQRASDAGNAAVAADPSSGSAGVVGEPREIP